MTDRSSRTRDVPVPSGFDPRRHLSGIGAQLAGQANVILQLSWPGVGYGVMNSRVHDGSAMRHPVKRARTTFTYLAVAMLGTDEERAAYRQRRHRAARPGVLPGRRAGDLPGDGPASADLGRGLSLLRDPRRHREAARPAPRGRGRRPLRALRPLRHHPPDAGRRLARRPRRVRRLLGGVARRGAHRPAGARLPAAAHPAREPPAPAAATRAAQPLRHDRLPAAGLPRGDGALVGRDAAGQVRPRSMRRAGRVDRALPTSLRIFPFNALLGDLRRRIRRHRPLV